MPNENLLEDVQSFPILTEEIGSGRAPRPAAPGSPISPGTSQLGQIVDGALREVLGWRPRATDSQGFVAALNQSFSVKEVTGHTEWKWTPRSYAVAAELGAVTGAQASIYTRAKAMLDQSLPLLEGIYPLNAAFDEEDTEAIRAIVKSSLTELVAELGREGGPRVARVDNLFFQLFGREDVKAPVDTENLDGQLGLLRIRFGLERRFVNTIDEEQNLTNYLILADNTISLRFTWDQQRKFFELKTEDVFLGTQTVQLARALAVVAESVEETYLVMDSVFLGSAERQVLELDFTNKSKSSTALTAPNLPSIFLGDLLSWVEVFATDEGPRLIRDGGKDGVIEAFSITADKLAELVKATAVLSGGNDPKFPISFRTARVRRALDELRGQLENVSSLAEKIRREPKSEPFVIGVRPRKSEAKDDLELAIVGDAFQAGMADNAVKLHGPRGNGPQKTFESKKVTVKNDGRLDAIFDIPAEADTGWYKLTVTNPDKGSGTLKKAFKIISNDRGQAEEITPEKTAFDATAKKLGQRPLLPNKTASKKTASDAGAAVEEKMPEKPASDADATPTNKS